MALRDDLDAALRAASGDAARPYRLDADGRCDVDVPLPPGLVDGLERIVVTVLLDADTVSFFSPLAGLSGAPSAETAETMLRLHAKASRTDGATFAIADDDTVLAVHHWIAADVTESAFTAAFSQFVAGVVRLHGEVRHLVSRGAALAPLGNG